MELKDKMVSIVEAQQQVFAGKLTIWNARLEAMLASGDVRGAIEHLGTAVTDANNCGCNNGCGGVVGGPGGGERS
ncbi:hypothetical protein [Neorhizobium sp. T25_27]|uniref:hypothetical protein n=1 Tax=Neorhizobium sp. T25_27 TaxID=2093831 RepID=UPI000CF9277D|nr:hypothetical protein [Neorhizobium sp. T25_27]